MSPLAMVNAQPTSPQDSVIPELSDLLPGPTGQTDERVTWFAEFDVASDGKTGQLHVTAEIIPGWHVFSTTQEPGGPGKTTLKIEPGFEAATVTGTFTPDIEPHRYFDDKIYKINIEEHEFSVTWSAPIAFADGVDPYQIVIPVIANGQVCENKIGGVCFPLENILVPAEARMPQADSPATEIRPDGSHATIRGWFEPLQVTPGGVLELNIEIEPDDGWYVTEYSDEIEIDGINRTLIAITEDHGGSVGEVTASTDPEAFESPDGFKVQVFREPVSWRVPITIPEDLAKGDYEFSGLIGFETASDSETDRPSAVGFTANVTVDDQATTEAGDLQLTTSRSAGYAKVASLIQQANESSASEGGALAGMPLPAILGLSFLAGLILNVMPCVLPVIGLKVLSFVQQAGEDPRRILLLNLTFAAGMIGVFLLLAALAAFFQVGWGGLFQSLGFTIVMVVIIFAFGLSFFGVWEIPIPGFVSTGGATKFAEREGYTGAFSKGILTTLLATPCSGPFLIPAVTWAITQPPVLTFTVFLAMGLGMAFPYIVIGFAPKLVNMLPKPGAWMETFKQLMGFLMMGTAVFFFISIPDTYEIPVLALLVFVGLACWFAGRISLSAPFGKRMLGWAKAGAVLALGCFISFYVMIPQHELDWEPYSKALLDEKLAAGHTVFVDFTADW